MKDTIDMAREARLELNGYWEFDMNRLKAFEALVRADEREALIEITQALLRDDPFDATASAIQLAIQNRGNT
jgi:hypothetical protein